MITTDFHAHAGLNEVHSDLQEKFTSMLSNVYKIWTDIGFDEKNIDTRAGFLRTYLAEIYEQIISGEEDIRQDIKDNVEQYKHKVQKLQEKLQINENIDVDDSEFDNLLKNYNFYKSMFSKFKQEKELNVSTFKILKTDEKKLCKILDEDELDLHNDSFVLEEDIDKLNLHIEELCQEKNSRLQLIESFNQEINNLIDENQIQPDEFSSLNQIYDISLDSSETLNKLKIDKKSMKRYRKSIEKLYCRRDVLIKKIDGLAAEIKKMWTQFDLTNEPLSSIILNRNIKCDYTVSIEEILINEHARCISLKRLKYKDYIENSREIIQNLWDEYFYSNREEFEPFLADNEITDELVNKHTEYLDKLKQYGKKNEVLFTALKEWNSLWEEFTEFDIDYTEPNRFKAKGYSALHENRTRKRFENEFTKLNKILNQHSDQMLLDKTVARYIQEKKDYHDEYKRAKRDKRQAEFKRNNTPKSAVIKTPLKSKLPQESRVLSSKKFDNIRESIFSSKNESPLKYGSAKKTPLILIKDSPRPSPHKSKGKFNSLPNSTPKITFKQEKMNIDELQISKRNLCLSDISACQLSVEFDLNSYSQSQFQSETSRSKSGILKGMSISSSSRRMKRRSISKGKPLQTKRVASSLTVFGCDGYELTSVSDNSPSSGLSEDRTSGIDSMSSPK